MAFWQTWQMPFGQSTNYESNNIGTLKIIGLILLVLLILLLVVHYTITPIFKTRPGKGYIPVPGIRTNSSLYWTSPIHDVLQEAGTPLENMSQSYSLTVDFYFNDLTSGINATEPRPIFIRYNPVSGDKKIPNLGMYLSPQVNDIDVKVYTNGSETINQEIIKVKNIVAKTPVRIGVIMGPNYFEVYKNGMLVGTRTLSAEPFKSTGIVWSSPNEMASAPVTSASSCLTKEATGPLGYSMNLNFWNRILSPAEMRYAGPAMPSTTTFAM